MKAHYSPFSSIGLNAGNLGTLKKSVGKVTAKGCTADRKRKKFDARIEEGLQMVSCFFGGIQKVSQ